MGSGPVSKKAVEQSVIAAMPGADDGTVATMRGLATATRLTVEEVRGAITSLRFRGIVDFKQLKLSPSMTAARAAQAQESQAKADDEAGAEKTVEALMESVSRGADARSSAATSEPMDVTAGETTQVSGEAGSGSNITDHALPAADAIDGGGVARPVRDTASAGAGSAACPLPDPAPLVSTGDALRDGALSSDQVDTFIAAVSSWLDRTSVAPSLLGELAINHPGFWNLLMRRRTARHETVDRVLAFIAAWPDGVTRDRFAEAERAAMSIAEQVASEAKASVERRRNARRPAVKIILSASRPATSPTAAALQRALLEQPEDAFAFMRRRWPKLLDRLCVDARAASKSPAAMLIDVIEAGLVCLAEEAA